MRLGAGIKAAGSELRLLTEERRPWGRFVVLDEGRGHKVKRIEVAPHRRLSYQLHHHRTEHWLIVQGVACVTLDGTERFAFAGQAIDVPIATAHRIENATDDLLVIVEVQLGDDLREDDIVRLEDDFGRQHPTPLAN